MKRCPECRRDYTDETLNYCLDDGAALVDGPSGGAHPRKNSATGPPSETTDPGEDATRAQIYTTERTAIFPANVISDTKTKGFNKRLLVAVLGIAVILAAGFFVYRYFTQTKRIDSIAVMPFVNDSGNPEIEYLSDGMTETLIRSLSQLPNLNVKARSSVFRYKGKQTDPQTIGNELKVQAILNGRIVQRGQSLILNIELIDAKTENVLWSQVYTRGQLDLVSLQTEIELDVSNSLRSKLSGTDEQKITRNYTADPEAYQLYLKGRYAWNKFTPSEHKKALEYFNQAIAKDPNYALAYVGLADTYGASATNSWILPMDGYSKAKVAAKKALEIDPMLAQAHSSLGALFMFEDFDWEAAEREIKRAQELDPNDNISYELHSYFFSALGRHNEAIVEAKRGLELDPLFASLSDDLAMAFYLGRDYDEAIKQNQKTLEFEPNRAFAYVGLGYAYDVKGLGDEAIAAHQKAISLAERTSGFLAPLGHAYAAAGRKSAAIAILNETQGISQPYVSPYDLAIIYTGLGDKENALAQLNKAYEERAGWMIFLKVEPQFDPLRSDPRFQQIIRKIGLS